MSDIIRQLPDAVANQIAAGEVIQRPSSVVKELIENAIDSGADEITLIIKEAGKTYIKVIDNGCGMSFNDARMAFDHHATSKVSSAEDIFKIQTKGFRGEALASIAAVSQVSLTTKRHEDETACNITIEGSEIIKHELSEGVNGTNFTIKNLFYNIPARRKFLKSNAIENKHITEEFLRVVIAHPTISFKLISNDSEIYNLKSTKIRQRIVNVFGKNYNEKLVPVNQESSIINISGFIGKPEFAKKTRGEQYLFLNNRYIKSSYFHHAISMAYEDLLPSKTYPAYFLFFEIDPAAIDINVHPTKTEIKFEDEKAIYSILRSTIKQSIGEYNVAPSIDFDIETGFENLKIDYSKTANEPTIDVDTSYNPFNPQPNSSKPYRSPSNFKIEPKKSGWESLTENFSFDSQTSDNHLENLEYDITEEAKQEALIEKNDFFNKNESFIFLQNKYILLQQPEGYDIIHINRALSRISYEELIQNLAQNNIADQQLLIPTQLELSPNDYAIYDAHKSDFDSVGFNISNLSNRTIAINSIPATIAHQHASNLFYELLSELDHNGKLSPFKKMDLIANKVSLFSGSKKINSKEHGLDLLTKLFQCEIPNYTPNGKKIIESFSFDHINSIFK